MNLTDEERVRCNECLKKVHQTKLLCLQSIQYLIEQQNEIDECIEDLKSTKFNAQTINEKISELNQFSWIKLCCFNKRNSFQEKMNLNEQNDLLILPLPNQQSNLIGLNQLEKDFNLQQLFNSMNNSHPEYSTKDQFEKILHDEYTILFELAKKLTKCVQILHDTIEFIGIDIKLTLEHMQLAQPRMRQLLKMKAPLAFEQVQNGLIL